MGSNVALDDRRSGPDDRRDLPRENLGRRTEDKARKKYTRQPKVRCSHCGKQDSRVVDGWEADGEFIRKRICQSCGKDFHSAERTID